MTKKILSLALVAGLLAGSIGYVANHSPNVAARAERNQTTRTVRLAVAPMASGVERRDAGQVAQREAGGRSASTKFRSGRHEVAEVFPGCGPRLGDWRAAHPTVMTIVPYPGLPVTFTQTAAKFDGDHLTWVGRNAALPGASFVGIASANGYDAVLLLPGAGQFSFHVRDGRVLMEEVVASGSDCAIESGPPNGLALGPPSVADLTPDATAADPNAVAGVLNVDVLFLYNTRALAVAAERSNDALGYIDGYARAALETANQVLQNSRVTNFTWRYVGLVAVPEYTPKVTVSEDLQMIAPDGPFADLVRTERARYGADQVLLWTGTGPRQGSAFGGLERNQPVERGGMVAALRLTAGVLILAHELAHNFGCHHDRGHAGTGDGSTAQPDGDGFWCYGLLWNERGATATTGTVMSYADSLVPYFSNPNLMVGAQVIGFPEADSRAAFNARIMTDNAAYIAAESVETEALPVILQHPLDATVALGQSMALSVSAVGGGLTYQWFKDGAAVAGASEARFSKSFVAADVGVYSVRITNSRGAASSRAATIALAAVAPAPTPSAPPASAPAASGGGGGGGGAPSGGFYLALLLAGLARAWQTRGKAG